MFRTTLRLLLGLLDGKLWHDYLRSAKAEKTKKKRIGVFLLSSGFLIGLVAIKASPLRIGLAASSSIYYDTRSHRLFFVCKEAKERRIGGGSTLSYVIFLFAYNLTVARIPLEP